MFCCVSFLAVKSKGTEVVYFTAAKLFLGDQRPSYNHDLKFTLRLGESRGYPSSQDIILEGARASISMNIYGQNNPEPSDQVWAKTSKLASSYAWRSFMRRLGINQKFKFFNCLITDFYVSMFQNEMTSFND